MRDMEEERLHYHAVCARVDGNYAALAKLARQLGSWKAAWERLAESPTTRPAPEEQWRTVERCGARLILRDESDYPPLLREIPHPPFGIYALGSFPPPNRPAVSIVGTRKATDEGRRNAEEFATALAAGGVSVISGLALGIDAAAHRGAIRAGGYTVAVLGTGLDVFSPRTNERLGHEILERGGAILSEYPPGAAAAPYHFLERNRIVSGLSAGTLIIEAPQTSGSLATARFALDQNRAVFVLPGPARHPNFAGSHALIRDGAELVTEPAHILEGLGIAPQQTEGAAASEPQSSRERLICNVLREAGAPLPVDKIIEGTKLNAQTVNQALSFLIIKNAVKETGSGYMLS